MATAIRPIGHDDRLTLVDHLDELRLRLIVSALALAIAFGVCLWQNHALLGVINKPLQHQTRKQLARGEGTVGQARIAQLALLKTARDTREALRAIAAGDRGLPPATRTRLSALAGALQADVAALPRSQPGDKPVTLSVGEPFTTTVTVSFYFALIISLPLILYELYGFVLPALSPGERRVALPLMSAVPVLFAAGVAFGYFIVLPAAVRFFVNFNASEFNVLVQASQFYGFAATILLAMGLVFQVPVTILGATRLGLVSARQLRRARRYALVGCALIAALLPGDVITLLLETAPLYALYEVSILLASFLDRSAARGQSAGVARAGSASAGVGAGAPPSTDDPGRPSVQDIVDHVDEGLHG
jgi:sec-independent protein translocase protein TatC